MKLTSTNLTDHPLFPLERTSDDFLNIGLENQMSYSTDQLTALNEIDILDSKLMEHLHNKIKLQPALTRQLVSFQANKLRPSYRWYKYKEAFSASLIETLLSQYGITSGKALDPFAGAAQPCLRQVVPGLTLTGLNCFLWGNRLYLQENV